MLLLSRDTRMITIIDICMDIAVREGDIVVEMNGNELYLDLLS